jgi:ABC-type uncharacterized transport system permease subunit
MDIAVILSVLDATLRLSTPLLLACLAGMYSERAGVFDIGLEGKMLAAAFAAVPLPISRAPPGPGYLLPSWCRC